MKGFLVELGVFLVLAIILAIIVWLSMLMDSHLGVPAMLTGVLIVGVLLAATHWLISRRNAKEERDRQNAPTILHPVFGKVKQLKDCWEAKMAVPGIGEGVLVASYEGTTPTEAQVATFCWIHKNLPALKEELEEALDAFDPKRECVPPQPRTIDIDLISLDQNRLNSFDLGFEVEGAKTDWGFTATFLDGKLEDFSDNH